MLAGWLRARRRPHMWLDQSEQKNLEATRPRWRFGDVKPVPWRDFLVPSDQRRRCGRGRGREVRQWPQRPRQAAHEGHWKLPHYSCRCRHISGFTKRPLQELQYSSGSFKQPKWAKEKITFAIQPLRLMTTTEEEDRTSAATSKSWRRETPRDEDDKGAAASKA
ncbi:hypothetical protein EJB05_18894 [Eragrostis curvula]|uniref:Uncharacterized protein n=1 Tax=Eragrostis curvula TaxID=38414 RepID=A0A5J9VMW8_9POAL|nr:hypothetical protein EJB05_18894 [Eragrostis curvula]